MNHYILELFAAILLDYGLITPYPTDSVLRYPYIALTFHKPHCRYKHAIKTNPLAVAIAELSDVSALSKFRMCLYFHVMTQLTRHNLDAIK